MITWPPTEKMVTDKSRAIYRLLVLEHGFPAVATGPRPRRARSQVRVRRQPGVNVIVAWPDT